MGAKRGKTGTKPPSRLPAGAFPPRHVLRRVARHSRHVLRAAGAVGAVGAVLVGVAACEPGEGGGLNTMAAAMTTDQLSTEALERGGVGVRWMSCTAQAGDRGGSASARAGTATGSGGPVRNIASIDCQGETEGGKKITVKGKVTEEHSGRCVRGSLKATVAGSTVFQANVLGNCASAAPTRTGPQPPTATPTKSVTPTVTKTVPPTHEPSPSRPPATPPATVTVTGSPSPTADPPPCGCETPDQRKAGALR